MTELALPPGELARHRRPRVGYAMTIVAATMFAINGAVAKIGLQASDMGTLRWTELRSTGGFIGLALGLALVAPHRLRIGTRRELGWLAFYGIVGFAVVQWLYFVAIERLPIGIGLLFEFSAPVLIALWVRFAWHEPVRRRVWPALGLETYSNRAYWLPIQESKVDSTVGVQVIVPLNHDAFGSVRLAP